MHIQVLRQCMIPLWIIFHMKNGKANLKELLKEYGVQDGWCLIWDAEQEP